MPLIALYWTIGTFLLCLNLYRKQNRQLYLEERNKGNKLKKYIYKASFNFYCIVCNYVPELCCTSHSPERTPCRVRRGWGWRQSRAYCYSPGYRSRAPYPPINILRGIISYAAHVVTVQDISHVHLAHLHTFYAALFIIAHMWRGNSLTSARQKMKTWHYWCAFPSGGGFETWWFWSSLELPDSHPSLVPADNSRTGSAGLQLLK